MTYTYNSLPHQFGYYRSHYDIEFEVGDTRMISLVCYTLVDVENDKMTGVKNLSPVKRAALDGSFEDAFYAGSFDETLIAAAKRWGYILEEDPDDAPPAY